MDMEEEMFEEHLDEEYQTSAIDEEFAKIGTRIVELEKIKLTTVDNQELRDKLEKTITLIRLHLQNYQRIIIFNRRRSRQRLKRRQTTLRNFFLQSLMEMQIRYVEMLPLVEGPQVFADISNDSEENDSDNSKFTPTQEDAAVECTLANYPSSSRTENTISNVSTKSFFTRKEITSAAELLQTQDKKEVSPEPLNFYKDIILKFDVGQWLDTFHMPKNIFDTICTRLKTSMDDIKMHFETWVAMCVYMFATGSKYCAVGLLFNVEKKFVRQSLFKFIKYLLNEFSENRPIMPKTESEMEFISLGFQRASNMTPCVVGVLSTFKVPNNCECRRYNTCGSKSLKVQICMDHRLLIRKVETTDLKPTTFLRSPNEISLNWKRFSDKCNLPYFVVAPPGYPLRTWLMQKYDQPQESWEFEFNKCFGTLNIFREVTLKRLFGRWNILNSTECIKTEGKSLIVEACCLLHNLLEESKEYFSIEWCKNFIPSKYEYRLSTSITKFFNDSKQAIEMRNNIAQLITLRKEPNKHDLTEVC